MGINKSWGKAQRIWHVSIIPQDIARSACRWTCTERYFIAVRRKHQNSDEFLSRYTATNREKSDSQVTRAFSGIL